MFRVYCCYHVHTLKRWCVKSSLLKKMVLYRTVNTQITLCIIKWFFVLWKCSSDWWRMCCRCSYIEPFRKGFHLHQKGFFYCHKLDIITIAEPFLVLYRTLFKKILYRTLYNTFSVNLKNWCKAPINHAKSSLTL